MKRVVDEGNEKKVPMIKKEELNDEVKINGIFVWNNIWIMIVNVSKKKRRERERTKEYCKLNVTRVLISHVRIVWNERWKH